jgi:hypothetical protein
MHVDRIYNRIHRVDDNGWVDNIKRMVIRRFKIKNIRISGVILFKNFSFGY